MKILRDVSLKSFNSFGVEAKAKYFVDLQKPQELYELFSNDQIKGIPLLVLGGGSNLLFRNQYFDGLIAKIGFKGIEPIYEDKTKIILKVAAGENWNELVAYTLEKNWNGLENLSLIPGTVGAAPVQNIGAYGVEVKEMIEKLEVYDIFTSKTVYFSVEDCQFGYRDSFFKNQGKNRFIILSVFFCLSKKKQTNLAYNELREEVLKMNVLNPSAKEISQAVIRLRTRKLPDPKVYGNGGSFFKNPIIKNQTYEELKKKYPEVMGHAVSKNHVKLHAGWLIEKAGWKGKQIGRVGVYPLQALVLTNNGGATGEEVYALSECITKDVFDIFGIALKREICII